MTTKPKTCGAECPDMDATCGLDPAGHGPEHRDVQSYCVVRWPVVETDA